MAASHFHALNIESDEDTDDEIDNTKEIQIEEALKIYQTALKYHSQGQQWYSEAGNAYKSLFESEIFKYPESKSEYERVGALEALGESVDGTYQVADIEPALIPEALDNAPSTLPQILHLSYKNRGRFHLDSLKASLGADNGLAEGNISQTSIHPREVINAATEAVQDFAEALDKDEGDLDLWRRTAKVGGSLGSRRLTRYCLEAALDGEDEGVFDIVGMSGIEEELAGQDLKKLTEAIEDDLRPLQPKSTVTGKTGLPTHLKTRLELYSFLDETSSSGQRREISQQTGREVLHVANKTWTEVGQAIMTHLLAEIDGSVNLHPASGVSIQCSSSADGSVHANTSTEAGLETTQTNNSLLERLDHDETTKVDSKQELPSPVDPLDPVITQNVQSNENNNGPTADVQNAITLPTRKRSSETAELPETAEGGRIRSKRIRARESIVEDGVGARQSGIKPKNNDQGQLDTIIQADQWLFEVMGHQIKRLGIDAFQASNNFRDLVNDEATAIADADFKETPLFQTRRDFYDTLKTWTEAKAQTFMVAEQIDDSATNTGLEAFLEQSKAGKQKSIAKPLLSEGHGLDHFVETVNQGWYSASEAAHEWIRFLLEAERVTGDDGADSQSTYLGFLWPEALKTLVLQILMIIDDDFYPSMVSQVTQLDRKLLAGGVYDQNDLITTDMIQTVFELHLDEYTHLTDPTSEADKGVRHLQGGRLDNWSQLAREAINLRPRNESGCIAEDSLTLRHLWASECQVQSSSDVTRDHMLLCIEDLRRMFQSSTIPAIFLQNNSTMPELSVSATERQVSKLTTMDFFLGIFNKTSRDPVDLIETLEPLLDAADQTVTDQDSMDDQSPQSQMTKLIRNATSALRLSLWQRLRESYEAIEYPPKVLTTYLRSIEILIQELTSPSHLKKSKDQRENVLLKSLRDINEMMSKILDIILGAEKAFEFVDLEQARRSIEVLTELASLLHVVSLYDDFNQINYQGSPPMNPFKYYTSEAFNLTSSKLHDMQIRTWVLLYHFMNLTMSEMPEDFTTPMEDNFNVLRHIHHAFGVRRLCKAADGLLLNLMKDSFLEKRHELDPQTVDDLSQVLYDLFDLQCFSSSAARQDHGCESDHLDRNTALQLIDFVMDKVRSVTVKDLQKTEMGKTIEKMHTGLGMYKATWATTRNRKVCKDFLTNAINPIELFRSLEGIGDLPTVPLPAGEAIVASKGWFFLKGQMALIKFKSQRSKAAAGPTEDVQVAIGFFLQDLEYSIERWETWYQMAQAYDALVDEAVLWSAEKIAPNRQELAQNERHAIHAYSMAVATTLRCDGPSAPSPKVLSELYTDFGNRMYSSSRAPFDMHAFSLNEYPEKPASGLVPGQLYTRRAFLAMQPNGVWKYAVVLYRQAIAQWSGNWVNHFMLGKCVWKMAKHLKPQEADKLPEHIQTVLDCFLQAIRCLPERKDPNRQEATLEPICKLVATVWKIFLSDAIPVDAACTWIETAFRDSRQFETRIVPKVTEDTEFPGYVLEILKVLRHIDKPHWHHRMVFRAAQLMHNGEKDTSRERAQSAKDYLFDQHMFSPKTMYISIWKPENESPGRHWVYVSRYYNYMLDLIIETNDRDAVVLLARRFRKKGSELLEQAIMWQKVALAHVKLYRDFGKIPENFDQVVFNNVTSEEFHAKAVHIDAWCQIADSTNPLIEILRETTELRRLNLGMPKVGAIDDLLADTYAAVCAQMGPILETPQQTLQPLPALQPRPAVPERTNVMSLNSLMNMDGTHEPSPTPQPEPSSQEHVHRPRTRQVSKREIARRAEAALAKPAPPPQSAKPTRSNDVEVAVVIPAVNPQQLEDGGETAPSSPPGSVHDSADDESELSEVEEEPVAPKSMFPNLKRTESISIQTANANVDDTAERNEEQDEDEEMVETEGAERAEGAEHPVPIEEHQPIKRE